MAGFLKVRADLIAGIPLGIWLGALSLLTMEMLIYTIMVMVAGPLLRQPDCSLIADPTSRASDQHGWSVSFGGLYRCHRVS